MLKQVSFSRFVHFVSENKYLTLYPEGFFFKILRNIFQIKEKLLFLHRFSKGKLEQKNTP
jgi:hypothetical protein